MTNMNTPVENTNNITILESMRAFSNELDLSSRKHNTIEAYLNDLKHLKSFIKDKYPKRYTRINDIDRFLLLEFHNQIKAKVIDGTMAGSSAERLMVSLTCFLNFLNKDYSIDSRIWDTAFSKKGELERIGKKHHPKKPTGYDELSEEKLEVLFDCILKSTSSNKYRDNAIFQFLCSTGARRGELLNLKWENIDLHAKTVYMYRPKTDTRERLVLSNDSIHALKEHYASHDTKPKSGDYIFKGNQDSYLALSPPALSSIIKKWASKAGFSRDVSAHTFRHYFVTKLLKKGVPPDSIIVYTGHNSVSGLRPYIHLAGHACSEIVNILNFKIPSEVASA